MKLFFISTLLLLIGANAMAAEVSEDAINLQQDAAVAEEKNIPIAILIYHSRLRSGQDLKEEALYPNLLSGDFDGKAIFKEIAVNESGTVVDFYGEPLPKKEYRGLYNITSLPAMVFVNYEGEEVTAPLFAGNYEYYGIYLKRKLNAAFEQMNNPYRFSE